MVRINATAVDLGDEDAMETFQLTVTAVHDTPPRPRYDLYVADLLGELRSEIGDGHGTPLPHDLAFYDARAGVLGVTVTAATYCRIGLDAVQRASAYAADVEVCDTTRVLTSPVLLFCMRGCSRECQTRGFPDLRRRPEVLRLTRVAYLSALLDGVSALHRTIVADQRYQAARVAGTPPPLPVDNGEWFLSLPSSPGSPGGSRDDQRSPRAPRTPRSPEY
jgi:hypothetical protein